MNETILQAAALIVPLVFAIVFHEVAHGLAARALGDPTAERMNRLSLNPLRHVDPIGTVILPGALALASLPVFGWAKPVPVNPRFFARPRRGMMLVGAAGPGANFVMALLAALLIGLIVRGYGNEEPAGAMEFAFRNLANFLSINVFLALFNLIPIPPFDGSHIVEGLLPRALADFYGRLRRLGMLLVIVLIVILPHYVPGFDPVGALIDKPYDLVMGLYGAVIMGVGGVHP